MPKRR